VQQFLLTLAVLGRAQAATPPLLVGELGTARAVEALNLGVPIRLLPHSIARRIIHIRGQSRVAPDLIQDYIAVAKEILVIVLKSSCTFVVLKLCLLPFDKRFFDHHLVLFQPDEFGDMVDLGDSFDDRVLVNQLLLLLVKGHGLRCLYEGGCSLWHDGVRAGTFKLRHVPRFSRKSDYLDEALRQSSN